jgi:protoporphyrinogen oxidase
MNMITTTKGEMDESLLEKRVGSVENDTETTSWVEYWLGEELVHRSVNMVLKRGVFADGETQAI